MRKTKLDRKMDIMRAQEEAGLLKSDDKSRTLKKFKSNKLAVAGLIIFGIIMIMTFLAPVFTQHDPMKINLVSRLESPSSDHIFGTDKTGRDVFARVLYGGRISIFVGLGSAIGSALIGVALGCYAGYKGGWLDTIVMRASEMLMSFPRIILVLLLVSIVGPSLWNLIFIFIISGWGPIYRQTRAKMLSIREEEYVQALNAFGLNDLVICYKHMLPNAFGPIMVNITLSTAMFILQETSLSFLGLGIPLNIPTWGNILNVAQDITVLKENWWIWLPVGLVISIFVLSVNLIGDGLRDSSDPTQQG
jgi:peptide/nickel transport system permease protein